MYSCMQVTVFTHYHHQNYSIICTRLTSVAHKRRFTSRHRARTTTLPPKLCIATISGASSAGPPPLHIYIILSWLHTHMYLQTVRKMYILHTYTHLNAEGTTLAKSLWMTENCFNLVRTGRPKCDIEVYIYTHIHTCIYVHTETLCTTHFHLAKMSPLGI